MPAGTLTEVEAEICAYEDQLRCLDESLLDTLRAELDGYGLDAGYFAPGEAYRVWANSADGELFRDRLASAVSQLGGPPIDLGEQL
jgi:hypothetical protein